MRHYAYVFLMGLFALVRTATAAVDDSILWIDVSGYKLTEAGELRPLGSLGGLSVTPGEGHVYSNASSYTSNQNTFTASVPFGYRVSKWTKAYDDPFVFTQGEDLEGSEGATSVTIPWNSRGQHVYLAVILEYDDNRTVILEKSPFGAGTIGTNYGTYACMKGDVFQLNALPAHDAATGFDRSVFRRWSDGVTNARRSLVVDTNLTLVAEFVPSSWEVSFDANGGSVCPTSKLVTCDASYGWLPSPVKLGHKFDGWYSQRDEGAPVGFETTVGAVGDHCLYARWTPVSYTIDFVTSGEGNGKVEGTGTYPYGMDVELTAKAYEGSVFGGWGDGETRNPRLVTVASNAVYDARFDVRTYDVTFTYRNAQGKEIVSPVQTVRHGGAATPPAESEYNSWPDHYFKTWSSDEYKSVTGNLTGDRSVLAIYDVETFAVTFVYRGQDGNAVTTMPQHVVAGEAAVPPTDSVADNWPGHRRSGWQPDYSVIRSDLTVEAIYDEYCTVDYAVVGEGNGKVEGIGSYLAGTSVELTAKPYEGSVFVGWEDGETRNPRRVTVTSNVVYGAVFDVKAYDVTFTYRDANGHEVVTEVQSVRHGEAAVPPDVSAYASWPFHTFKAWSTEEYKKVMRNLTGNDSVRAIYDEETFAVTFVYQGRDGNAVTTMPQHVVAGASAIPPPDSVANNWAGHKRVDWQPDYSVVRSDLTVEAVYEPAVYDVDFIYFNAEGRESTQRHQVEFEGLVPFDAVSSLTNEWTGHAFRYWSIGGNEVVGDVVVSNDLRIVAVYDGLKFYEVTFVYNDQDGNAVTTMPQQVLAGTSAVPPPEEVANKWIGHTLTGWEPDYSVVLSNLVVEAIYDADVHVDYVISGDGDGVVEGVGEYAVGSSVTLTATPREGSEFKGWEDGEIHNPRRVTVTSNVTYGAKFDLKTFDVAFSYRNKDGREVAENKKAKYGKSAELPKESDYNRWSYHSFTGWSSTEYMAVTRNLTGNESIKAEYKEFALVIYDANGGEGGQIIETNYTDEVTLKANTFVREGYVFQCWTNTAKQVSGRENEERFPIEMGTRNQFDAYWEPIKYWLEFNGNGEGDEVVMVGLERKELTYDKPFTLTSKYPDCYAQHPQWKLVGWDRNPDCEPESVEYRWKAGDSMTVTNLTSEAGATVTYHAIWDKD